MSADDFLFCRKYEGGFLVTRETLSQDVPSPAAEAFQRATGPDSYETDGFFDDETQAEDFIDALYDKWDEAMRPFEYGPEWSDDPNNFLNTTNNES